MQMLVLPCSCVVRMPSTWLASPADFLIHCQVVKVMHITSSLLVLAAASQSAAFSPVQRPHLQQRDGTALFGSTREPWGNDEVNRRAAFQRFVATGVTAASGLVLPRSTARAEEATVVSSAQQTAVPTVRLGGGSLEVSRTIQGYWQLAGGHGRYKESDAIANMKAHFDSGITTLDTADIYGPSELIVGKFMKDNPQAIPCTKFCCFRYLEEIDRQEVRLRVQKVRLLAWTDGTYAWEQRS